MMRYITDAMCRELVFPFIHKYLSSAEAAPTYEFEAEGMEELEKVLSFIQDDRYYPTFAHKCAYLLCGCAAAQYFSNGNKRLGVALLLLFLIINETHVLSFSREDAKAALEELFPHSRWDDNPLIDEPLPILLYNLAVVAGDRTQWNSEDFQGLKERCTQLFDVLFRLDKAL